MEKAASELVVRTLSILGSNPALCPGDLGSEIAIPGLFFQMAQL